MTETASQSREVSSTLTQCVEGAATGIEVLAVVIIVAVTCVPLNDPTQLLVACCAKLNWRTMEVSLMELMSPPLSRTSSSTA